MYRPLTKGWHQEQPVPSHHVCGSTPSGRRACEESRSPEQGARPTPHLTLMRTPVVKRQTLPKSGFYQFFSAVLQAKRRPPWQRVLSSLPSAGAPT